MTHHGDEHVGENDNDGHVVECEEEQPDTLDHRRGVAAARESRRVVAVYALGRPFDLDVLDRNQAEHRPEQAVQRQRQPGNNDSRDVIYTSDHTR